ncbi:MAG TPA: pyruvate kinase [Ignavibacteriaceae bacterium]|nr:pyruvate kinase [Ignavibacteriaceae bacterium]
MTDTTDNFTKTKILATLGPATSELSIIRQLIRNGIDGVRLNMSHSNHQFYEKLLNTIHTACTEENTPLSILADLQGPKIRIGDLEEPEIEIKDGRTIEITTEDIIGNEKIISASYKSLVDDAAIGDEILINDGLIRLIITDKKEHSVVCLIQSGGILSPRKGMNLPGMKLSTPSITEKDFADLKFLIKHRVDFIALSFVRSPKDIILLKSWLREKGKEIPVIAKIEKKEAIENLDEILKISDGIMIARGDLGVEFPPQEVPVLQKNIITKCNEIGKLVITATQMLESMINSPIPTRAEASDIANAVWDGTDVVMLSGETSIGKYPLRTVSLMNDIVIKAESITQHRQNVVFAIPENYEENLFDSVGRAISDISKQINADAIVVLTNKGRTAVNIAKFRPACKIIAISNSFETMNKLCLRWGVTSLFSEQIDKEYTLVDNSKKLIVDSGLVKKGDMVVFTAGAPYKEKSRFNWFRFEAI